MTKFQLKIFFIHDLPYTSFLDCNIDTSFKHNFYRMTSYHNSKMEK